MFDINQFRECIVKPALSKLNAYSDDAAELLVFTCAAESAGGTYLTQIEGPALGIYQCEPDTHNDIWRNFLFRKPDVLNMMTMNFNVTRVPAPQVLAHDLLYASAIARLHYMRVPHKLPKHDNVDEIWKYYKEHYNTAKGDAEKKHAIKAYSKFTGIKLKAD